jgi:hypothetical protein
VQLRAVAGQDLSIARIGRLATEHHRRAPRPAENLVEEREPDLPVSESAQIGSKVARPEALVAHFLLQRWDQRGTARIGEVARMTKKKVKWLNLGAYELVSPGQLRPELVIDVKVEVHVGSTSLRNGRTISRKPFGLSPCTVCPASSTIALVAFSSASVSRRASSAKNTGLRLPRTTRV